ncbi:MAG: hypothetical protein AB7U07_13200 [Thermoleophilia bacterium]
MVVTLSRRNLRSLLHKLDWPASARTITNGDAYRDGEPVGDVLLVLRAEEDEEHYARRPAPPGPMHPRTERAIADGASSAGKEPRSSGGAGSESSVRLVIELVLAEEVASRALALVVARQDGDFAVFLQSVVEREVMRRDSLEAVAEWEREHGPISAAELDRLRGELLD